LLLVSGGGGWGSKKGLLSLDPQTTYRASGDEDVQTFIEAFQGQGTGTSGVSPGAYVQYLVEDGTTSAKVTLQDGARESDRVIFGTAPAGFEDAAGRHSESLQVVPGVFGAVSTGGLFLDSARGGQILVHTKLDVPNSYVYLTTGSSPSPRKYIAYGK
jgi:hypothetical protein